MRLLLLARVLAFVLLAAAALSPTGVALAHDLTHAHLSAEHAVRESNADSDHGHDRAVVPDHAHEHAHPSVDQTTRERIDLPLAVVLTVTELPAVARVVRATTAPISRALLPRGDPRAGPPPQPRAPPVR